MGRATPGLIDELLSTTAGRLEDVAREAGVSYSALYSWATGRRRPSRQNRKRLAEVAARRGERLKRLAARLRHGLEEAEESTAPGSDSGTPDDPGTVG